MATDAAVNKASAILTATIIAPDLTPPMVSFDPEDITLESGETAESVLEVLDDVDGTLTPEVNCTNGGVFDIETNQFAAPEVATDITSICTATAFDGAGNEASATLTASIRAPAEPAPPPPPSSNSGGGSGGRSIGDGSNSDISPPLLFLLCVGVLLWRPKREKFERSRLHADLIC